MKSTTFYIKKGSIMANDNYRLEGAELASMLKSTAKDDALDGGGLNLPPEKMEWWQDAKFGMFIHWGLYAIVGTGEWCMHNDGIPKDEYRLLADRFSPKKFDADRWMKIAKVAGCKYAVMTSRHHDGFALWNSASSYGDFTSAKTAAKRDFIREYTDAARKNGLYTGIYYSPMDWRFPGYFDPEGKYENALLMKKQCYGQVEELVRDYGRVDILWYDGGWLAHTGSDADAAWLWDPIALNTMVKKYQPDVVINPRSGLRGDFVTEEGGGDVTGAIRPYPWEKCMTVVNGPWGYSPNAKARPYDEVLKIMIDTFTRGGNVLLNVGPDPDGEIPEDQAECFRRIGEWMEKYGESVYGTRGGPIEPVDHVFGVTTRDNVMYVHITNYGEFCSMTLPLGCESIISAEALTSGDVTVTSVDGGVRIALTETHPVDTVVKLTLKK